MAGSRVKFRKHPQSEGEDPTPPPDGDVRTGDWSGVRDLVQSKLAALDGPVRAQLPSARARPASNRGGGAHLFTYRVYESDAGVDPVVVGVTIGPNPAESNGGFRVRGDIAGETLGDVLFELPPQDAAGWEATADATRVTSETLARQADHVVAALRDRSRKE